MTSHSKADRLPWFHCYPSALLGALSAMSAEEQLVYFTTLLRIYETRGPIRDDDRALARRTGLSVRKVVEAKARLLATGKLIETEDGAYTNPVAQSEIEIGEEDAKTISAKRSVAAKSRWQKIKQNQQTGGTSAVHEHCTNMQTDADSDLEIDEGSQVNAQTPSPNPSSKTSSGRSGAGAPRMVDEQFERFKQVYPKRKGAQPWKPAREKFNRLCRAGTDSEAMIAGAKRYATTMRSLNKAGTEYVARALTWLNEERWTDDQPTTNKTIITIRPGTSEWDQWRAHYADRNDSEGKRKLREMNDFADKGAAFPVPSEQPPTIH